MESEAGGRACDMERARREKKAKVDVAALSALSNAKRGVVNRADQVKVRSGRVPRLARARGAPPRGPQHARGCAGLRGSRVG